MVGEDREVGEPSPDEERRRVAMPKIRSPPHSRDNVRTRRLFGCGAGDADVTGAEIERCLLETVSFSPCMARTERSKEGNVTVSKFFLAKPLIAMPVDDLEPDRMSRLLVRSDRKDMGDTHEGGD